MRGLATLRCVMARQHSSGVMQYQSLEDSKFQRASCLLRCTQEKSAEARVRRARRSYRRPDVSALREDLVRELTRRAL